MDDRYVDGTERRNGSTYDEETVSIRECDRMPEQQDFDATEPLARAVNLHVARLHRACRMVEAELLAKARGADLVTLDSSLADAVGRAASNGSNDPMRANNALEDHADILTVRELLDAIRNEPDRIMAVPNFAHASLVNLLVAIIENALKT